MVLVGQAANGVVAIAGGMGTTGAVRWRDARWVQIAEIENRMGVFRTDGFLSVRLLPPVTFAKEKKSWL